MNVYIVGLIFLTSLLVLCVTGVVTSRPRVPLDRLADPRPLPGEVNPYCPDSIPGCNISHHELPRPGRFDVTWHEPPFDGAGVPFDLGDTGPLIHLSEHAASLADLERETARLVREAEAKIPPRWRT